ncbi:MAG TPA: HAMP domain-containing sensor histidine kinase [Verrucomicrobiales bacterium]|nr:HAMP domain-containing sensor histidine kinase [Verrucomicrobiales bacterium]
MKTIDTPTETGFLFPALPALEPSPAALHNQLLLRGLTHKLNNLLSVVKGNMGLLQMDDALGPEGRNHIEESKRACDLMAGLGDRIRACAGCSTPEITPVAAESVLLPLPNALQRAAASKGIELQTHAAPALPHVWADPGSLRDILSELVANAIEASADGSIVSIQILAPGMWEPEQLSHVDVFVRNPSPALSQKQILALFQPFHTSKGGNHSGTGLTLALALATQMGMPLGIRNTGQSTDVWLRLPVV